MEKMFNFFSDVEMLSSVRVVKIDKIKNFTRILNEKLKRKCHFNVTIISPSR